MDLKTYHTELEFDLARQEKPIEVLRRIQAIGTDLQSETNCDLVICVIELICRISQHGTGTRVKKKTFSVVLFPGTILVFLPGWNDIAKCTQLLRQRSLLASYLHILPLHSLLPLHNQQEIFGPAPDRRLRKVILSTSIAETSITIDDVIYVIDTGRTKASDYDLETQGKCLLPTNVSRANLLQRKGSLEGLLFRRRSSCFVTQEEPVELNPVNVIVCLLVVTNVSSSSTFLKQKWSRHVWITSTFTASC